MKKGILYLLIFNVLRFALLFFVECSSASWNPLININPESTIIQFDILQLYYTSSAFLIKNNVVLLIINAILLLVFQLLFLSFTSNIIRNDRKYLTWIMLISSVMLNPLATSSFLEISSLIFWTLTLHMLYHAIFNNRTKHWIFAGIFMGLAFNCRQIAAALPIGMLIFLIFSTKYRHYFKTIWPYITIVLALAFSFPFIFGRLYSGYDLILYSAKSADNIYGFFPQFFIELLGSQSILLLPVLFVGFWWIMFKYLGRIFAKPNQVNSELWFLLCFFIPMFLGLYTISFFYRIEISQLIPVYVTGLILLGKLIKKRWLIWHIATNIIMHILLAIVLYSL